MNLDWRKIKNEFRGFESLALEFVQENEKPKKNEWKKTKQTRDKNHDAVLCKEKTDKSDTDVAVFVGYSNDIDVWWMEAKYSSTKPDENKVISRYRLDATIVSAILTKNIIKVIFVTNLNISSKTISDIRNALVFSTSCRDVVFYTKNHLESWLLKEPYKWLKKYFDYKSPEFNYLDMPSYNPIEELTFYKVGYNLFQEPLTAVYTDFVYEIHFSIYVQKEFTANLKKSTNIELTSNKISELKLKPGDNNFIFNAKIPRELQFEKINKKDVQGEYKAVLPISLVYTLEDISNKEKNTLEIISSSALRIVSSEYYNLTIPSQEKMCKKLLKETINNIQDANRNFSLVSLSGKSGVGKSYILQLYKNRIKDEIICSSYIFCGDKLDDMKQLKKFIFNLFFPFIYYEDLDNEYIEKLQGEDNHLSYEFWDFVFYADEIEAFMKFSINLGLMSMVFPENVGINNRVIILDDVDKLSSDFFSILSETFKLFIKYKYPIFCIAVSHKGIDFKIYKIGKEQRLLTEELVLEQKDIEELFLKHIDIAEAEKISLLFGSVIEIVYFLRHISESGKKIKNTADFKYEYKHFTDSEILTASIVSKFKSVFKQNSEAENLCSCIYYTSPGIHRDIIYASEKSVGLINLLLENELVKKDDDDFFVVWHDYYKKIYIEKFELKKYEEIDLPFETTYNCKIQFQLHCLVDKDVENVLEYLKKLYAEQKFYSIYYILENKFSKTSERNRYKEKVRSENYFLLFAYFCYSNTNASTVFSSREMFYQLYSESSDSTNPIIRTINYISLWELINCFYESDEYDEAMEKISIFNNISENVKNNWVYLFEWDYNSLKYSVSTVKMFIDSEKGINCLDKVPGKEKLPNKDVAFSTYRLLLCNLTNDFDAANKLLREYNEIIQNSDIYDNKTKYMYDFTVKYLDCIDNKIDISDVISANNMLKDDYFNDYNRHIFAVAILSLLKRNIDLCETYRMEYIKTNRPMKKRQLAFQAMYSALINLYKSNKEAALAELDKTMSYFERKASYMSIISHNINYVNNNVFSLRDVEFYFGDSLCPEKYYIDIRMLY